MTAPALKLAFMGTPDFAVPALEALLAAGHDIGCVYTQPPRPAGRGKQVRKSPVHRLAEARGLVVRTPETLKGAADITAFAALDLDAAVVVAYGLILPQAVLDAPRLGCFNIHASLLPRWRGAAPIQRAILAGDEKTGISIMRMDAGLDTGAVVASEEIAIGDDKSAADLHDALREIGARLMVKTLAKLAAGEATATPQPETGVTLAAKISKGETKIDWTLSAQAVARGVRGYFPAAWFELNGERVRVLAARPTAGEGRPGDVLQVDPALAVACRVGAVAITRLQRAGKKAMAWDDFKLGNPLEVGRRLAR